jgi:MoaA/NifB/PqqE/SkfB family radical SAM enzyme
MTITPNTPVNQWVTVDESGRLVIDAAIASQYGLTPGAKVRLEPNGKGIKLRRPVNLLSKIYVEPSGRCNLDCRTCIRNVWLAPDEIMDPATYDRILADLPKFSPTPTIFFGGLGEPLMHPDLPEMIAQTKALGARVELITNSTLLTKRLSRRLIEAGLDHLWVSLDGATPRQLPARPAAHQPSPQCGQRH